MQMLPRTMAGIWLFTGSMVMLSSYTGSVPCKGAGGGGASPWQQVSVPPVSPSEMMTVTVSQMGVGPISPPETTAEGSGLPHFHLPHLCARRRPAHTPASPVWT